MDDDNKLVEERRAKLKALRAQGFAYANDFGREHLAAEVAYLEGKGRVSFERPYGLAWLLQLVAELREWMTPEAKAWAEALAPLERAAAARIREWLPKLTKPVRIGEHSQTAFALGLTLDWARGAVRRRLAGPQKDGRRIGSRIAREGVRELEDVIARRDHRRLVRQRRLHFLALHLAERGLALLGEDHGDGLPFLAVQDRVHVHEPRVQLLGDEATDGRLPRAR